MVFEASDPRSVSRRGRQKSTRSLILPSVTPTGPEIVRFFLHGQKGKKLQNSHRNTLEDKKKIYLYPRIENPTQVILK
jgi:hypothetical protein